MNITDKPFPDLKKDILVANNINKSFRIGEEKISILKDIDLTIRVGDFVAIMGRSGSGKSTLLSLLAGLDKPTSGVVKLNGSILNELSETDLALKRQQQIGFIFQSFHLIPSLTVEENIAFPLHIRRQYSSEPIDALLDKVGLQHRKHNFPQQLSGGEKQRTAIARALISRPSILFADEPTGNLDETNARLIMKLLKDLQEEYQTALIVVTHDKEVAALAERTVHLINGQLGESENID